MKAGLTWLQEMAQRKKISAVPVPAQAKEELDTRSIRDVGEVREGTATDSERKPGHSRSGRTPFDRKAYQREYMRLYRAAKKLKK